MAIVVPPRFRIVEAPFEGEADGRTIAILPSRAFGDGRHESTRMCLQALAAFAPRGDFRVLDVGSGSGILAIGAAKMGGRAVGIEIDEEANEHARANAEHNAVADRATFGAQWPEGLFEVVIANILRGVLLDLANDIVRRVAPGGVLVLSGLVSTDVPSIVARYGPLLGGARPEAFARDEWRALVWRTPSDNSGCLLVTKT